MGRDGRRQVVGGADTTKVPPPVHRPRDFLTAPDCPVALLGRALRLRR